MPESKQIITLRRLGGLYHYRMPRALVGLLDASKYNNDVFLDSFCKLPSMHQYSKRTLYKPRLAKLLVVWSYYVWTLYLVSAIVLMTQSVLGSLIVLLFLPLIVAGLLYIIVYFYHLIKNPSIKGLAGFGHQAKNKKANSDDSKKASKS